MIDNILDWKRTKYCGNVTEKDIGDEVILMGWVQRRRDHGGLIFIDLRDRDGIIQVVFNPELYPETHRKAHHLRCEFVVAVKGRANKRPEGTENPLLKTGTIEIQAEELKILNDSAALPFIIEDNTNVGEDLRLKYRYLDLRRRSLQKNIILRHRVCRIARDYLSDNGFVEIETPMLTKSTPEGARDYLVPSRLNPGKFYALPQSPQLFKQILMIAGFDRYFQIVRCFRDEDLRADRQPEFTQIDAEMSFVDKGDVMELMEGLMHMIFKKALGIELSLPFQRLTYDDAIDRFGVDNPDTRFELELKDITSLVQDSGFMVFKDAAKMGGVIKAINVKGCAAFSRKDLDELTAIANEFGAKGLAWVKVGKSAWQSPIVKFMAEKERESIGEALDAFAGDLLIFVADYRMVANTVLGRIRTHLGERLNLTGKGSYNFVWITDFPLLEFDEDEDRYVSVHHPFTSPTDESLELLDKSPLEARAKAYDLVLNGNEIGGGSIRICRKDIQSIIFNKIGIKQDEARERFGFLLDGLEYGAPPHGGFAFGLDRLVAIMAGANSIRDVIAFPKTQKASCLLTDAPSTIKKRQLEELGLKLKTR